MISIVRINKGGVSRVLAGAEGMVFEVDKFTVSGDNLGHCAHVRDYRYPGDNYPYQIWSLGRHDYEHVTAAKPATKAIEDVVGERKRQVEEECWTPEHDDNHGDGEMAEAAAAYAIRLERLWPRSWDLSWWKPKSHRRNLVRAAALLIAEIERLDRMGA